MMDLSVVIPVYNAENILNDLIKSIDEHISKAKLNYELILVNDSSPDKSWKKIVEQAETNNRIIGLSLSRNFGQHAAITAGLNEAKGNYIVVMDCDLQDDPKYIPSMYDKALGGFDVVCTIKKTKEYSFFRVVSSNLFFWLNNLFSGVKLEPNLGGYVLINRKVLEAFLKLKDVHRHFSILLAWLGFKRGFIEIVHNERHSGKSSYNFSKLFQHAINGIISNSTNLLSYMLFFSFLLILCSLCLGLGIFVLSFFKTFNIGWPSIILSILFSTGIILFAIGVTGLYVGKILEQTKGRPLYIIDKKVWNG